MIKALLVALTTSLITPFAYSQSLANEAKQQIQQEAATAARGKAFLKTISSIECSGLGGTFIFRDKMAARAWAGVDADDGLIGAWMESWIFFPYTIKNNILSWTESNKYGVVAQFEYHINTKTMYTKRPNSAVETLQCTVGLTNAKLQYE